MRFSINSKCDMVTFDIIMTDEQKEALKQKKINEGKMR